MKHLKYHNVIFVHLGDELEDLYVAKCQDCGAKLCVLRETEESKQCQLLGINDEMQSFEYVDEWKDFLVENN